MCHWKKWIFPGLLTVALLSFAAIWMKSDIIEADLKTKATADLQAQGLGWATVSMDGRDATVTGNAPTEASRALAANITDGAYDVRIVKDGTGLMAAQSPYTLKAVRSGDAVELTGFVPDDETRATVVASAQEALPGVAVTDSMTLAPGAPEGLTAIAGFGLTQLAGLPQGEMEISDTDLTVRGAAVDRTSFDGVNTALDGTLPGGARLALRDITAPAVSPYTWGAATDGSTVALSGYVPDDAIRATVLEQAAAALPGQTVTDAMLTAPGAPADFTDATSFALAQLPRFAEGDVGLTDQALAIRGTAINPDSYDAAIAQANGTLDAGLSLASADIVAPTVSPYEWAANYDGSAVALSGFVPDDATRTAINDGARAALPDATITDNMRLAAGAPEGFADDAAFALTQLPRFDTGDVALSDKALTVNGAASSPDAFDAANTAVAGTLPAGVAIASSNITAPTVSPYEWAAYYDGSAVTLSGFVPDDATRTVINDSARAALPDATVTDNMRLAAGAPEGFGDDAAFALAQLPRFNSGNVALNDKALTVNGAASSPDAFDAANTAVVGALPAGVAIASSNITTPTVSPYEWGANYDGERVVLNGFVPDDATRTSILDQARAALPDAEVSDEMRLAAGAPAGFAGSADFAIRQLPRFQSGRVGLTNEALAVQGVATDPQQFRDATAALDGGLPAGTTLASSDISPATVSPYNWAADYDGSTVTLSGLVPDAATRTAIVDETKAVLPEAEIVNQLALAQGEPDGFTDQAKFALGQLERFTEGRVGLEDSNLSIEGRATTPALFDEATAASAGTLGGGATLASSDIKPATISPYTWRIAKTGDAAEVTGFVPGKATGLALVAQAKRALPGVEVTDRTRIAAGAPAGFATDAAFGIAQMPRFSNGSASLSDKSLAIEGTATDTDTYGAALAAANGTLPGELALASADIRAATVTPYTWGATLENGALELTGYVPDEEARAATLANAATALPSATITDNMRIAAGEPATQQANVDFALAQLPRFNNGSVGLEDTDLSVSGVAKSGADFTDANAAVTDDRPAGVVLVSSDITPPTVSPYSWSADYDGSQVVLSGYVPDGVARDAINEAATARLPDATIVDRMEIAAGAPDTFEQMATGSIGLLPRFTQGSVALSGTDLDVNGTARNSGNYTVARRQAAGELAGATIRNATINPPKADGDYLTSFTKTPSSIVIAGLVPSPDARTAIGEEVQAANAGRTVVNRTTIATGEPAGYRDNITDAIGYLDRFSEGSATLTNESLALDGTALSVNGFAELTKDVAENEPRSGYSWGARTIRAPAVSPFSWRVAKGADRASVSGFVPDDGTGRDLAGATRAQLGQETDDTQRVAGGAPESFGRATRVLLDGVQRLDNSSASITDTVATIEGRADSEADATAIGDRVENALPENYRLRRRISFPLPKPEPAPEPAPAPVVEAEPAPEPVVEAEPAPEPEPTPEPVVEAEPAPAPEPVVEEPAPVVAVCDTDFEALFDGEKVRFDTNRAVIKAASFTLLDRLAEALAKCEGSSVTVAGHTDSRGGAAYNQSLSQARAQAVLDYMEAKGVDISNMEAKGFGEAQPIASNRNRVGRAQNRRIEITVTKPAQ